MLHFTVMDRFYALIIDQFEAESLEKARDIVQGCYATYMRNHNFGPDEELVLLQTCGRYARKYTWET